MSSSAPVYTDHVPPGYQRSKSGLILPEEISRRQAVPREKWKHLERAVKMVRELGVRMLLECENDECKGRPLERVRRIDGGITLRCKHRDLEFTEF